MLKAELLKVLDDLPDDVPLSLLLKCRSEKEAETYYMDLKEKKHGVFLQRSASCDWELVVAF